MRAKIEIKNKLKSNNKFSIWKWSWKEYKKLTKRKKLKRIRIKINK
jgi:hypothetical protein